MTLTSDDAIMETQYHDEIVPYLKEFLTPASLEEQTRFGRIKCCNVSRSLYCCECYSLLVPQSHWPLKLQTSDAKSTLLPFNLCVVLHDRRKSATGLHAAVLDKANQTHQVTVVDIERGEPMPQFKANDGTYLLFPSPDSVPLASAATSISTLVVLDCKWTRSSSRDHASISNLPKVHLTNPPVESSYWRWHNAGSGMLSTMEAVYVAAKEVSTALSIGEDSDYLALLWLFALQRAAILRHTQVQLREPPFTDAGKEEQRALRRQRGTEKQNRHAHDALVQLQKHARPAAKKPRWCSELLTYVDKR
jgi:hypothetical protein